MVVYGPKRAAQYIYVICRPGGLYWEKLCQRSWVRPEACRPREPYPRPRAQFFPIRTDQGRQITCLLFSSVEYFASSFCVEFSLQPFSNLVYARVWHLGNRKSKIWIHNCLFLRSLFTFYVLCSENCWKRRESWKIVAVRTRGPDGKIRTAGARAINN